MINIRKLAISGAALVVLTAISGCGEREQVIQYQQGKYQGKPDSKPWESAPGDSPYTSSKWTKGDKSSWESTIRSRNQSQNEYVRIGE